MENQRKVEPGNVIRECEYLRVRGEEIARTSSWVLWTWNRDQYFNELHEYCRFYQEMKGFLATRYTENEMITERVQSLPDIKFKNKSLTGGRVGLRLLLLTLMIYVFFPLAFLFLISGMRYINKTRRKIFYADSLLSSIAFILKVENR